MKSKTIHQDLEMHQAMVEENRKVLERQAHEQAELHDEEVHHKEATVQDNLKMLHYWKN